jgi:Rps23 Pro-64 3,4-dihydroxylase Tpa1-like proline 4-hydroxylase
MMDVFDGFLPEDALNKAIDLAENSHSYTTMHNSYHTAYGFKISDYVYDPCTDEDADYLQVPESIRAIQDIVAQKIESGFDLKRIYINAHPYGVEDSLHKDSREKSYTAIVYLVRDWYVDWGGETAFFTSEDQQNAEITKAVLPKYNRFVVFDGSTPHNVRSLSRRFSGVRYTMMFKYEKSHA